MMRRVCVNQRVAGDGRKSMHAPDLANIGGGLPAREVKAGRRKVSRYKSVVSHALRVGSLRPATIVAGSGLDR